MTRETRPPARDLNDHIGRLDEKHVSSERDLGRRSPSVSHHRSRTSPQISKNTFAGNSIDMSLIEASASEVSLMWLLHWWALPTERRSEPLDLQIRKFSLEALRTIDKRFQHTAADEQHLWLIYFKGLLAANTHSKESMVEAINILRFGREDARRSSGSGQVPQTKSIASTMAGGDSDFDVLEQISEALGYKAHS